MYRFFPGSPSAAALALLAALNAALWLEPLLRGKALFYDTLFRMFFPNAAFLRRSVLGLELPLWNAHIFGGVPFLPNIQTAVFYPVTYLHVLFDFPAALALSLAVHGLLAAWSMRRLALDFGRSEGGALLAGIVYAFNGHAVMHYAYPSHFHAYAWLPLILVYLRRALESGAARDAALAGLLAAVQILAGHTQVSFYTALAALAFAASAPARRAAPALAVSGAAALAVSAVQWAPTAAFLSLTARGGGRGYEWATEYSLAPAEALRMLAPWWNLNFNPASGDSHTVGFYFGLAALLIATGLAKSGRERRLLGGLFAAGVLLALGRHLPGYRFLYEALPPFRWFRFPAQALTLACLSGALLAARGYDSLRLAGTTGRIVLALVAADLFVFARAGMDFIDPAFYSARMPTAQFLREKSGFARIMMTPKTRMQEERAGPDRLAAFLKFRDSVAPNLAMAEGLFDAWGSQQELMRFRDYDAVLEEAGKSPLSPWLDRLSVRYLLSFWPLPAPKYRLAHEGSVLVYENTSAWPRAFWTRDLAEARPEAPAVFWESGSGRISIEAEASEPGYLVVSGAHGPGWSALLNGQAVELLDAHRVLRAAAVDPGRHRLDLRYTPPYFHAGAAVSLAGLAGLFFLLRRRS